MNKTFIITDIGINHAGSMDRAKDLIDIAVVSGVDAVKFQHWGDEYYRKCEWRQNLDGMRFTFDELKELKEYTKSWDAEWFCTAFDYESFKEVKKIGQNFYKIPNSNYVKNDELLVMEIVNHCKNTNSKLMMSSGYPLDYVTNLLYTNKTIGIPLTMLYCISKYPPKIEEIKLSNLRKMIGQYSYLSDDGVDDDVSFGISDHSSMPEIPILAVAAGAEVVEVHLTLDKDSEGPDHKASLMPDELLHMLREIRRIERYM